MCIGILQRHIYIHGIFSALADSIKIKINQLPLFFIKPVLYLSSNMYFVPMYMQIAITHVIGQLHFKKKHKQFWRLPHSINLIKKIQFLSLPKQLPVHILTFAVST